MNFSPAEAKVVTRVQRDIPLVKKPFRALGDDLGLDEADVIRTIARLKNRRTIRDIAGIFEPAGLGYCTTLVAMKVPGDGIGAAATAVNGHPGVSHNYLRNHEYNVWFTLAEESEGILASALGTIAARAGALDRLAFRNEQLYKICLNLPVGDDSDGNGTVSPARFVPAARTFSRNEREAVLLLQRDLPLNSRPFDELLRYYKSSLTVDDLLAMGNRLKEEGYMRRYSAVIRPVHTGYRANAMTAWKPAAGVSMEAAAEIFSKERAVTHLYRRTIHPGKWEHPLFAMIHAREENGLTSIVARLSGETGIGDYMVLDTVSELKKEKVIYFSTEFEAWRSAVSGVSSEESR